MRNLDDSVAGLVPAAGASRRMGRDKRRLRLDSLGGRTVLEATVGSLIEGGVSPVVVVLEPRSPCRPLEGLSGAALAINPDPRRGMLSSIRVGLAQVPDGASAVAILPGDHPFVPPEAVSMLVAHFRKHHPLLLAPLFASQKGHPLIIARALFSEVDACDDAVGLRQLVWRRRDDLMRLELGFPRADRDLDTPEDLE